MSTLNHIVELLIHYRYFLLLPIAIVEGPIITIIAGFLSSINQLNFYLAYLMVVLGDLLGDSAIYYLGRRSSKNGVPRWLHWLGVTEARVILLSKKFSQHPKKIFFTGKITHGAGSAVLFVSGLVRFPFREFLIYNILFTLLKSGILMVIGFYFGKAYVHIKEYIDYGAIIVAAVFAILYVVFLRFTYAEENEETSSKA